MTLKTIYKKEKFLGSGLPEFIFLVAGLVFSVLCFIRVNAYVQNFVEREYNRISENIVWTVADGMKRLEDSTKVISSLILISPDTEEQALFERIKSEGLPEKYFDQLAWIREKTPGKWVFSNIYTQQGESDRPENYEIKADNALLSYLRNNAQGEEIRILSNPDFFRRKSFAAGETLIQAQPFAVVRPLVEDGSLRGFVVGVSHMGRVLDPNWLQNNEFISAIRVRDPAEGYDIYKYEKIAGRQGSENEVASFTQVYEFHFAGHRMEIRTDYFNGSTAHFLGNVSLAVLALGVILTMAGTLYITGRTRQKASARRFETTIQSKNRELESEIARREALNTVLSTSEQQNRALIDAVSDIIFETDTAARILFLNVTWQKITGFRREQSEGAELFNMLYPQDQEKQKKDFQLFVDGQKKAYRAFTRLRISDGTFRAVELAFSMIRRDDNNNLRVVGTITDVEERRRAERALSEAEKKYRTIVDNAAGGIFQLTPEGIYLSANPAFARILGYESPEELLHKVKNANEAVYFNARERQIFIKELEMSGHISNYETQVLRKNGTRIWVNENIRAVRDDAGVTLFYEGSMEDITHRKEADIALREAKIRSDLASRAKSEFLANMSHELRTPLNSIIGFSEIIKNEVFGKIEQDSYREYATDIHESGKRLLQVINEILDISKIEAGDRKLNDQQVNVKATVDSCLSLLSQKAGANQLTVTNTIGDIPDLLGEQKALKQIIINLLSNAIKFTLPGGRVTISSDVTRDGGLQLCFSDTGVGLDEVEITKALSPFGQINNSLGRTTGGAGLGLTLADALVKLHGGKLELFSQKGIGTNVTVIFPPERIIAKKPAVKPHQKT